MSDLFEQALREAGFEPAVAAIDKAMRAYHDEHHKTLYADPSWDRCADVKCYGWQLMLLEGLVWR